MTPVNQSESTASREGVPVHFFFQKANQIFYCSPLGDTTFEKTLQVDSVTSLADQGGREESLPVSSTAPIGPSEGLSRKIGQSFNLARSEDFEDGMESDFARNLIRLVKQHGNAAMETICQLIVYEPVDPVVANEALKGLAQMKDSRTYEFRRWLLERSLFVSSHWVRDGAAVGLATLDDPRSIPQVRKAMEQERYPDLRHDLEQVLEQLEATKRCLPTSSES